MPQAPKVAVDWFHAARDMTVGYIKALCALFYFCTPVVSHPDFCKRLITQISVTKFFFIQVTQAAPYVGFGIHIGPKGQCQTAVKVHFFGIPAVHGLAAKNDFKTGCFFCTKRFFQVQSPRNADSQRDYAS